MFFPYLPPLHGLLATPPSEVINSTSINNKSATNLYQLRTERGVA